MSIINIKNKAARRLVLALAFVPLLVASIAVTALQGVVVGFTDVMKASSYCWRKP